MIRFLTLVGLLFLSAVAFAGDLASSGSHVATGCDSGQVSVSCGTSCCRAQPPYDLSTRQWTFDPAELISVHDIVYEPPKEPWEAMPVGGGDLSAMVRCTGGSLDLHLTKSDAWGFQPPPDAPSGSRFFNNVSPGT